MWQVIQWCHPMLNLVNRNNISRYRRMVLGELWLVTGQMVSTRIFRVQMDADQIEFYSKLSIHSFGGANRIFPHRDHSTPLLKRNNSFHITLLRLCSLEWNFEMDMRLVHLEMSHFEEKNEPCIMYSMPS